MNNKNMTIAELVEEIQQLKDKMTQLEIKCVERLAQPDALCRELANGHIKTKEG
jgi:hypothetical protein